MLLAGLGLAAILLIHPAVSFKIAQRPRASFEQELADEMTQLDAFLEKAKAEGRFDREVQEAALRRGQLANYARDEELRELERTRRSHRGDDPTSRFGRAASESSQITIRLEVERDPARRAAMQARLDALDAELKELWPKVQTKNRLANAERARRAGQARMAKVLRSTPWARENPDLRPNGCATCANSSLRFTEMARHKMTTPTTADAIRDEATRRYPGLINIRKPMAVRLLPPAELAKICGRTGVVCAQPNTGEIWLQKDTAPSVIAHETMHSMSSPRWFATVPETVNEGMTEYFTRDMGYFRPSDGVIPKAYDGAQVLIDRYISEDFRRKEALERAYFAGDFSMLEKVDPGCHARMAEWDKKLKNQKPGSSTTRDDEDIVDEPAPPLVPYGWGA